jgi:hypothetical protein
VDAARRILKHLGVELHPQKRGLSMSEMARVPWLPKQARQEEAFFSPEARFVVRPNRVRCMRIPRRSRSVISSQDVGYDCSGTTSELPASNDSPRMEN